MKNETHIQPVENIILRLLVLHEELQVLEDPLLHGDGVGVADGVLTQEVEVHHKLLAFLLLVQRQVLVAQRAAANRVRSLPLLFLVSRSQGKLQSKQPWQSVNAWVLSSIGHSLSVLVCKDGGQKCNIKFKGLLHMTEPLLIMSKMYFVNVTFTCCFYFFNQSARPGNETNLK